MNTLKKQQKLPKGFLSTNDNPTLNSIVMYFVYIWYLPKGWSEKVVNLDSVQQVRAYFGVDYGFENMIRWGLQHGCCKSKTSSGRHESMSQAYQLSKSLVGAGVQLGEISIFIPMLLRKAS